MKRWLCFLLLSAQCTAAEIAITIDDPKLNNVPLFSQVEKDDAILAHLNTAKIKATLFVTGKLVDNHAGRDLLARWDQAGHQISNHSYSHLYYHKADVSVADYIESFERGHALIKDYDNFVPRFRYPYLKAGDTELKRDRFRQHLTSKGYGFGYVSIDNSDWYIDSRLVAKLRVNSAYDYEQIKTYYLAHLWQKAQYYDDLAKQVLGRSPKHTLLLHHNLLNALFLDDVIQMFNDKGWKVIDSDEAFNDPIYRLAPNGLPAGESIIWSIAKEQALSGLRYPAEEGNQIKQEMDEQGL